MIEDEDSDVLDFLHSVQREDQIKIISWFLFQVRMFVVCSYRCVVGPAVVWGPVSWQG